MPFLKVENIHKSFGAYEVLKGVGFELKKGGVLAIIGSSGSGKTTLLRCIAGLECANSGEMSLENEVFFGKNRAKNAQNQPKIGMVFQSFYLFPHYNVQKNLTLAARLQYNKTAKRSKCLFSKAKKAAYESIDERALSLLRRVGLEEKAKAYPCELSGGQQQRVAIARALMIEPDVLCFDEPTSALDPELTREVLRVIRDLKGDGHTMIVVTHEMEFAKNVADEVLFMADGKAEEFGTPEQVFENPKSPKTAAFLANTLS